MRKLIFYFLVNFYFLFFQVFPVIVSGENAAVVANDAYKKGDFKKAVELFTKAQLQDSFDPDIAFNLGSSFYRLGKYQDAEKSFLNALNLAKDAKTLSQIHYDLGNNYYRQGKLDQAIKSYQEAIKIEKDDEDAKYNLEFVQKELKRRADERKKQTEKNKKQQKKNDKKKQKNQQKNKEKKEQNKKKKDGQNKKQKKQQEKQQQKKQKQQQKKKASQPKDRKKNVKKMTDKEALRWLSRLKENRKDFLKRQMQKRMGGRQHVEKDW
ncbi:tetratricopeptide repeat protein [Candidatus Riflebacteria bacterium]